MPLRSFLTGAGFLLLLAVVFAILAALVGSGLALEAGALLRFRLGVALGFAGFRSGEHSLLTAGDCTTGFESSSEEAIESLRSCLLRGGFFVRAGICSTRCSGEVASIADSETSVKEESLSSMRVVLAALPVFWIGGRGCSDEVTQGRCLGLMAGAADGDRDG